MTDGQRWQSIASAIAAATLIGSAVPVHALRAQVLVTFPTPDSGVVYADQYGRGSHGVVLAHGGRFDKGSWKPQAQALAAAGFRVLAIDFRGRGRSRGGRAGDEGVHYDVLGAIRYLRSTGTTYISAVGASFGGGAVADASMDTTAGGLDRLVLLAHSLVDHPERIHGRKLFIVSRGDTTAAGVPRLVEIRKQFKRAPDPKELVVLDGTAHAQFLFQTDQSDPLLQEILRFLSAP